MCYYFMERKSGKMSFRRIVDYSKGDDLTSFWIFYSRQVNAKSRIGRIFWTYLMNRSAHRHGGYIGAGALISEIPMLPHGIHGIYISRFASVGSDCCIYQNVTIGEVNRKAPKIGNHCLIGAGAVLIGDIRIGNDVKIGAGAVVHTNVPDGSIVVPAESRIIQKAITVGEAQKRWQE